ncbi:MAG: class I adenylate-forming enzyme family protein [Pseudomonadota bacterium]
MTSPAVNLAAVLQDNARNRPDHPALLSPQGRYTYQELWTEVSAAAAWLAEQGVTPGDRVALALTEHPAHLSLHFAIAWLGGVLVPLDHRWTVREKQAVAGAMAVALLIHEASAEAIEGTRCAALPSAFDPRRAPPIYLAGDPVWLVSLSSGTTGQPKGSLVTHQQMLERFINQWVTLGFNANDRFYAATPLYFGAGRSFALCFLIAGATVIMSPPPQKPEQVLREVADSEATVAFLVPTQLRRIAPLVQDAPAWPGLRRLVVSGEPLFPEEAREFQQTLCPRLLAYYASSEGGGISILQPEEFAQHADTVGRPGFRVEVAIVDGDGKLVNAGEVGRLRYRSPGLAQTFVDEAGKAQAHPDGWFYPGDLASQDERGFVTLRGREKDMIIRGGVNIYPAEIERFLAGLGGVTEAAVVGRDAAQRGQEVVAFYAGSAAPEELEAACREQLAPYKVPSRFERREELPKAASGKINKKQLA